MRAQPTAATLGCPRVCSSPSRYHTRVLHAVSHPFLGHMRRLVGGRYSSRVGQQMLTAGRASVADQWLYLLHSQTPPSLHPMSVARLTSESCTRSGSGGAEGTDWPPFFSRLSSGVLVRPALSRHRGSGLPWPSVRDGDASAVSLRLCCVLKSCQGTARCHCSLVPLGVARSEALSGSTPAGERRPHTQ